jgi:hypothetical protein
MAFDTDLYGTVPGVIATATAHDIPCDRADILNGSAAAFHWTAFDAHFDPDWKLEGF